MCTDQGMNTGASSGPPPSGSDRFNGDYSTQNIMAVMEKEKAATQPAPVAPPVPQFSPGGQYQPGGSPYLIDPVEQGRMSGSENMSKLHRAMWEDHKNRFAPVQQMLVDRYQDPTYAGAQTQKAGLTMAKSYDGAWEQGQRGLSRYGVTPSGDQSTAQRRSFERNKSGAVTDAKNTAQTALKDQKMGLMMGGLSSANSQRRG